MALPPEEEGGLETNAYVHDAAARGLVEAIPSLVAQGVDPSAKGHLGRTPLHVAILAGGNLDIVRELIRLKVEVNITDDFGYTPLHYAVTHHQVLVAQYLLYTGANVNFPGPKGNTPLHFACMEGRKDMCELLMAYGAHPLARNDDNVEPFALGVQGLRQFAKKLYKWI